MKGLMTKLWARAGLALAGGLLPWAAQAQNYPDRSDMWGWGWGQMIFGSIMMVAFWGGIILLVVLLVRWLAAPGRGAAPQPGPAGKSALDILKERFARGEIDTAEFEERRRALGD